MSYPYPLTPPTTPTPSAVTIIPEDVTALEQSDFTLAQTSYDFGGERIRMNVELPPMTQSQAASWAAFFLKLKGVYGTFTFGNPAKKSLLGTASGTILVNGAGQTGTTLNVDGVNVSQAIAFNVFDHIAVDGRLKICVANSSSDGSGLSALSIWPAIVTAPADNAAVTTSSPTGTFRLAEPISFSIELAKIYGFSFTCIEAF